MTASALPTGYYCEFANVAGGHRTACIQGGVNERPEHGVCLSIESHGSSFGQHMSAAEARHLAAHLTLAADRYEAIHGAKVPA